MSSENLRSDKNPAKRRGVSRREFARGAAIATAAAAALPRTMLGETPCPNPETALLEQANSVTPLSRSSQAEVEVKVHAILNKYGSRFSGEQKAEIRRLVTESQTQIDKLRAYALDNSDQPATVLKPLMERPARSAGTAGALPAAPAQKPKP